MHSAREVVAWAWLAKEELGEKQFAKWVAVRMYLAMVPIGET